MSQAGLLTYSRFMSFPFRPTKQWMQYVMKRIKEFTAAGLSGTLRTTGMLGRATDQLTVILAGIGMHDAEIWQNQLEALYNPKEMVEVRHNLNVRRQKLREQIEFNIKKIDEAKKNIAEFAKDNPQYANDILEIANHYGCADL